MLLSLCSISKPMVGVKRRMVSIFQPATLLKCRFSVPGQGAQYPGMLKTLALQFPGISAGVSEADQVFAETAQVPRQTLTDLIYPRPLFSRATGSGGQRVACYRGRTAGPGRISVPVLLCCNVLVYYLTRLPDTVMVSW
jgi:hypothetical protein